MPKEHDKIELTDFQIQVMNGLMLGDGHLSKVGKNALLSIGRARPDLYYLIYEAKIFYNLLSPTFQEELIKCTSHIDKRNGRVNLGCYFITTHNQSLTEIHNKWYQNKIKIIPNYLKLTATTVAHWIADDGHVSFNKLPYRFTLELSTNSFTKDEVMFLIELLTDRYNEKFKIKVGNNKNQFTIRAYDSAMRAIIQDIDPYFKMDRKRTWDEDESRYYINPPERQVSLNDVFSWRLKTMKDIIDGNDKISLTDLRDKLGYDGKPEYRMFNSILKRFPGQYERLYVSGKECYLLFKH